MLHCVRALFSFTQGFVLGFQGEKVTKNYIIKAAQQLCIDMTSNQHVQAAAESVSLWGRKEGAATGRFLPFFGHFSGYLATSEVWSGSSLCRDQPDTSIPHTWSLCVWGQWKNRAWTLQTGKYLLLIHLWLLCVPTQPLYSIICLLIFLFCSHWFIHCSTGTVQDFYCPCKVTFS